LCSLIDILQQDIKRKRDIKEKISLESKRINEEEERVTTVNRELCAMLTDATFWSCINDTSSDIAFKAPELVVVGMQSDGKSSFVEALLGFQLNLVESSIR
jgi:hypothetical protein